MNAIFDENSEFLKYLKQNEPDARRPEPSTDSAKVNPSSLANISGIDLQKELGSELFNEFAQKTNLPIGPKETPNPENSTNSTDLQSRQTEYVLDLKSHQLKDSVNQPEELIPVKKNNLTSDYAYQDNKYQAAVPRNLKKLDQINKLGGNNNLRSFIFDKLKFILVSGLIFSITFLALNWSAYSKIFENWYLNFSESGLLTPLNNFTNGDSALALLPSSFEFVENSDIPKLNIEVTPPGMRVIIPRLRSNVPIVGVSESTLISRDWDALESEIQKSLQDGVVHYPGTPYPNESGNTVLTGHSSYYPWDPGRFKDVFAVLHQAVVGDEIIMFYDQQKYAYKITDIQKVLPSEVNVLGDSGDDRLTLITCTPIGTNLKRLIITAKPVD